MDFRRKTKKVRQLTEEQKKWISEYRKNDRTIFKTNINVTKILKFSRTTRLKKDVIKIQKMVDDNKFGVDIYEEKMKEKVKNLKVDVKKFKEHLKNFSTEDNFLLKIENHAEFIKNKITEFKEEHIPKYETIQDEIDLLDNDIKKIQANISEYEKKPIGQKTIKNKNFTQEKFSHNLIPNTAKAQNYIEEFFNGGSTEARKYQIAIKTREELQKKLDYVQAEITSNGGVNCGWSSKDHLKFTKTVFRMKGRVDSIPFFDEMQLELPLYSESAVKEHVRNWKIYTGLDKEKKDLLEAYKEARKEIKELEEEFKMMQLRAKQRKEKRRYGSKRAKEDRMKKKEMIRKWKQEKEVKKVVVEEKDEELKKFELDKKWRKRQKELQKKKREILEYKEMKRIEREREVKKKDMNKKEKRYISADQRKRIRDKEQRMMDRRKRLVSVKKEKSKTNAQLLQEMKYMGVGIKKFEKVKSRLRQETTAVIGKQRGKFDPERDEKRFANNMGGMLLRNQGRAMVGWKKGR